MLKMGMYDYVGHSGDQVKCFYLPNILIKANEKDDKPKVFFNTLDGMLRSQNNARYMTPYYNYGPNFAIVDDGLGDNLFDVVVHLFREGQWVETKNMMQFTEDYNYNWPPVTINKYGERYKVSNLSDLIQMEVEYQSALAKQESILNEEFTKAELSRVPKFEKWKTMSQQEIKKEFKMRCQIEDSAYNQTMAPFFRRYRDNHDVDLQIIGLVVEQKQRELHDEDNDYGCRKHSDEEWKIIINAVYEQLKDYLDPIKSYFEWCDKERIVVDKQFVRDLFMKYKSV